MKDTYTDMTCRALHVDRWGFEVSEIDDEMINIKYIEEHEDGWKSQNDGIDVSMLIVDELIHALTKVKQEIERTKTSGL